MGWKSTVNITRDEAIDLIIKATIREELERLTNDQLDEKLEALGYGETLGMDYYGHNFIVEG